MPEDASLDQFASPETTDSGDAEENADAESEPDDAVTEPDESPGAADPASPEAADPASTEADESEAETLTEEIEVTPAVSTYAWSSEGGECADCGAPAERLWRGDGQKSGGLVCDDCKKW